MVETHDHFVKRLSFLGRKHEKLTNGYTTKVGRDGLIVVQAKRSRNGFPLVGLLLVCLGFVAFKAFMLAAVGPTTYNDRLVKLENGTIIEQAGAKALAVDPITASVANFAGPIFR